MLRELGPADPAIDGKVLLVGALFFLICGFNYRRIADFAQKRSRMSDAGHNLDGVIMIPMCFLFAAGCLLFAFMLLMGYW